MVRGGELHMIVGSAKSYGSKQECMVKAEVHVNIGGTQEMRDEERFNEYG
jgi:hypothetical protein